MSRMPSVLIVEDEAIFAQDLAERVVEFGARVVGTAASSDEALKLAVSARPDLVLLDIRIHGRMDGIEVGAVLRTTLELPVVFLTAHADDATIRRASLVSPFGYLTKPVDDRALSATMQVAMARHGFEQRLVADQRAAAAALASIDVGVVAVGAGGRIDLVNAAAGRILARGSEELVGRTLTEELGPEVAAAAGAGQRSAGIRIECGPPDGRRTVDVRSFDVARVYPTDPERVLVVTPR